MKMVARLRTRRSGCLGNARFSRAQKKSRRLRLPAASGTTTHRLVSYLDMLPASAAARDLFTLNDTCRSAASACRHARRARSVDHLRVLFFMHDLLYATERVSLGFLRRCRGRTDAAALRVWCARMSQRTRARWSACSQGRRACASFLFCVRHA